jgi:hypothetical protein
MRRLLDIFKDISLNQRLVRSLGDLQAIEQAVLASAQASLPKLEDLLARDGVLSALAALKFGEAGYDPLDSSRSLNLVGQLKQSFTYLASMQLTGVVPRASGKQAERQLAPALLPARCRECGRRAGNA